jgi:hypothetical protein
MAGYGDDDGVANNGFGRRSLHQWELVDATADGIPLVRVGVIRVGVEVGIPLVSIDAEDGEEGAAVGTADQRAQQRRPRHPREGAHLVTTGARPQAEAEEGGRSGRSCV